jgi:hypothetical protein
MITFSPTYSQQLNEFYSNKHQLPTGYIYVGKIKDEFVQNLHIPQAPVYLTIEHLKRKIGKHKLNKKLLLSLPYANEIMVVKYLTNNNNIVGFDIIYDIFHDNDFYKGEKTEGLILVGLQYYKNKFDIAYIKTIHAKPPAFLLNILKDWNNVLYINKAPLKLLMRGFRSDKGASQKLLNDFANLYDFIDQKVAAKQKFFPEHLQHNTGLSGLTNAKKPTAIAFVWGNAPSVTVGFKEEFIKLLHSIDNKYHTRVAHGSEFINKNSSGLNGLLNPNINKKALVSITKGDNAGAEGFNEDSQKILTQIYDFIDQKVAAKQKFFPEHLQHNTGLSGLSNTIKPNAMKKIIPSKYAGWQAYAGKGAVNIRTAPGLNSTIIKTARNGETFGTVVGLWHSRVDGYSWYAIVPNFTTRYRIVYAASGYFNVRKTNEHITPQKLMSLVNSMLNNDRQTARVLYPTALKLMHLYDKGKITKKEFDHYSSIILSILQSIRRHQQLILEHKQAFKIKTTVDKYLSKMASWFGLSGLGIAPMVIGAIIGVVVGLATAAFLYYLFKPAYDESTVNLKISKRLKQALDSLPEADRQQVINDLEHQIDDAYNQGKTDQRIGDIGSSLKYLLLATGAVMLFNQINQK